MNGHVICTVTLLYKMQHRAFIENYTHNFLILYFRLQCAFSCLIGTVEIQFLKLDVNAQ